MASLTIRNIDEGVKKRLRQRAATHGVSMEEEARLALRNWVQLSSPNRQEGLGTRLRRRFESLGGVELDLSDRGRERRVPDIFEE